MLFFFTKGFIILDIITINTNLILNKVFTNFHKLDLTDIHFRLAARFHNKGNSAFLRARIL